MVNREQQSNDFLVDREPALASLILVGYKFERCATVS
jgi:hypothetical protein